MMSTTIRIAAVAAMLASNVIAHAAEPKAKILAVAEDPTQKTVLVGRTLAGGMLVIFELEPAKGMWMPVGGSAQWMEHAVAAGERYHVEVKPVDPRSKTRISYADIKFAAVNRENGKKIEAALHPMWGGSGLHYAANSPLAGDGTYQATITVGVPTFSRDLKDKDRWMTPAVAKFHFKLRDGKLVEVSEPEDEPQK